MHNNTQIKSYGSLSRAQQLINHLNLEYEVTIKFSDPLAVSAAHSWLQSVYMHNEASDLKAYLVSNNLLVDDDCLVICTTTVLLSRGFTPTEIIRHIKMVNQFITYSGIDYSIELVFILNDKVDTELTRLIKEQYSHTIHISIF